MFTKFVKRISSNNFYLILLIFFLGLLVFWSSFKLALDGDNFLGQWRFDFESKSSNFNYISFLLTDYGPEDLTTVIFHKFVGFQPLPRYLVSFVFRFLASISFIPLVKYLTKNKTAAFISSIFFMTTCTGIEATDWVFNMPSYLGIILLNIFLYSFMIDVKKKKTSLITLLLYFLTIVIQPIRMAFLPGAILLIQLFIAASKKESVKYSLAKLSVFIIIFLLILKFSSIGDTQIIKSDSYHKDGTFWTTNIGVYMQGFKSSIETNDYRFILTPFANFISLIIPVDIIPYRFMIIRHSFQIFAVSIISIPILSAFYMLYKRIFFKKNSLSWLFIFFIAIWISIVYYLLHQNIAYPMMSYFLITYFVGFPAIILLTHLFLKTSIFEIRLGMIISMLIIFFTIFYLWLKSPLIVNFSYSRYLIVPAAGLSILFGILYKNSNKKKLFLIFFMPIFFMHMFSTFTYLKKLSKVRATGFTERIRNSIPDNPKFKNENETLLYYFTTNNEAVLYHSLMFGFPVIMHYQYGVNNPWRLAYTTNWSEVVSAYTDGESMRRFVNKPQRIDLENIYSFELVNHDLNNQTVLIRERLKEINFK